MELITIIFLTRSKPLFVSEIKLADLQYKLF